MGGLRSGADRALALIRTLPRISLGNLRAEPPIYGFMVKKGRGRGEISGKRHGWPHKGPIQRMNYTRIGFEDRPNYPFYIKVPLEHYYKNHHLKRQYPPLSFQQLQMLIDTNRLPTDRQIDITTLCNTQILFMYPEKKQYGYQLSDEGIDTFKAKINLEVQWATERVIAAIEKNGGTITTAFYDTEALRCAIDPKSWFLKGKPIPKRMIPPEDAIEYYTDPKFRGYLADPDKIAEERLILAQKYGYVLPDLNQDPNKDLLLKRKDPKQIFYGLEPGWVVNLKDKCILKPTDERLLEYYKN